MAMRVALSLIVLSALLAILAVAVEVTGAAQTGTNTAAEMKQLTLADVNQATEQQDQQEQKHQEMPAVRLVRQLGAARRFGRFGGGGPFGGFGGGPFGGGGRRLFGGGGGRQFVERREFFNGGGFGFGQRPGPGFFPPQPFGFFG